MTFVLLTGAGFSRNWGGWLANEAFEYLIGCPEIDTDLRARLWASKAKGGGFEDTLAELQAEFADRRSPMTKRPLRALEAALIGMFNAMDQAFAQTQFEPQNDSRYLIRAFLARFDAIFTLNQDLLLERHYLDDNIMLSQPGRWNGWQIPGLKSMQSSPAYFDPNPAGVAQRTPDPASFQEQARLQPYYKLHGSANWIDGAGSHLLVMGGDKSNEISRHPLLKWYHRQFSEYLDRPGARLMVIGYSFGDGHINRSIMQAADKGNLGLFLIDPLGTDVLDKQPPRAPLRSPGELMTRLNPRIRGASRRPVTSIFAHDRVEYGKVMRFFEK